VTTDKARTETVPQFREVPGALRPAMRSTVAARQAGLVVQINVDPGGRIEAGKVLAKLDDRYVRLEVTKAEAQAAIRRAAVSERQAGVDKAKRNAQRYEAAFKASGVTEGELDEARTAQAEAEARLAQAQAELSASEAELGLAKERFQDMTIRAPFTGVVAAKRAEAGEWVTQGAPVAELVASESIDAWLDVPEGMSDGLRTGAGSGGTVGAEMQVRVSLPAAAAGAEDSRRGGTDIVQIAKVAGFVPAGEPGAKSVRVRARLENPGGRMQPGMRVVGLVPTGQSGPGLTVAAAAVHQRESGTVVVFEADGRAAIAPVAVVAVLGDRVVVTSPVLKDGMEVVVDGGREMVVGQAVERSTATVPAGN
jgi:RND family efflux transporter MFP subunit